jgi:hypothetical protein
VSAQASALDLICDGMGSLMQQPEKPYAFNVTIDEATNKVTYHESATLLGAYLPGTWQLTITEPMYLLELINTRADEGLGSSVFSYTIKISRVSGKFDLTTLQQTTYKGQVMAQANTYIGHGECSKATDKLF